MTFSREKFRRLASQNGGLSDFIATAASLIGDNAALEALQQELSNARKGKSVLMPWQKAEAVKMALRGEMPTVDSVRIHKRLDIETEEFRKKLIDFLQLKPDAALKINLSGSAVSSIRKELFKPEHGFESLHRIFNKQVMEPLERNLLERREVAQYIKENDDTVLDILRAETDGKDDFQVTYQSPTYEVRQEAKRQKWEAFLKNGARVNRAIEAPEKASFRPKSALG